MTKTQLTNEQVNALAWDAYDSGEIILDGITYEVIGGAAFDERLEDSLDGSYEPFKFGDYEYTPSQVLRNVDPILYGQIQSDEANYLATEERVLIYGESLEDAIRYATTVGE